MEQLKEEILNLGSDNLHVFGGRYEGGIHLQQNIDEAVGYVSFLINKKREGEILDTYLEVGSAAGGNAYLLAKYLNLDKIIIVNDNKHPKWNLRKDILKNFNVKEFIGDSQSEEMIRTIKDLNIKFDMIFIDADHSYNGVKKDTINYSPFLRDGGYLLFHDTYFCVDVTKWTDEIDSNNMFSKVADFRFMHGVRIYQK